MSATEHISDEEMKFQDRVDAGEWWRERTRLPLIATGMSFRNTKRLARAARNQGNIKALNFDYTKGLK